MNAVAHEAHVAEAPASTKKAPPKVETVKMDDGRIVEFVGKRKMLKTQGIDEHGHGYVRFDFANGETRTFTIPKDLILKSATHGWSQKLGDEAAGEDDVEAMIMAVDALAERLHDTSVPAEERWNKAREAGDSFSGAHIVIRAMVDVLKAEGKPITVADVKASLEKKLKAANEGTQADGTPNKLSRQGLYKIIRAQPRFGARIRELEAEKEKKSAEAQPVIEFNDL